MGKLGQKRGKYNVKPRDLAAYMAARTDSTSRDDCWPWTGWRDRLGYGRLDHGGRRGLLAHRVAYELATGSSAAGLLIRHDCDNPPCVNPSHLRLGTDKDNSHDMWSRGRGPEHRGEANPNAALSEADVLSIRAMPTAPVRVLAERFGIKPVTVSAVRARRCWRHI